MFLQLITLVLSFCLLLSKKKDNHVPGDDESCKQDIILQSSPLTATLATFLLSILWVCLSIRQPQGHTDTVANGHILHTTPPFPYGKHNYLVLVQSSNGSNCHFSCLQMNCDWTWWLFCVLNTLWLICPLLHPLCACAFNNEWRGSNTIPSCYRSSSSVVYDPWFFGA